MSTTVASPTPAVMAAEERRRLPRALMGGTTAMRAAGDLFLPQEQAESDKAYQARLRRSFLFNGYAKAVKDSAGKVFRKPIAVGEDVDATLMPLLEDVDLGGRNLDVFAHAVFTDALAEGVSYILADMDPALAAGAPGRVPTRAETKDRRPWAVHITAAQVLGWRSAYVGGRQVLTQFRFMETVEDEADEFGAKPVQQIRVFGRDAGGSVTFQIWRRAEKQDGWTIHDEGRLTIDRIPVAAVQTRRAGFMNGTPPMSDLAEVNLAHWQSQSDQRNILHIARVPILFGAGIPESAGALEIGAGRMVRVTEPNAKLTYVEHTGAAIGAGRTDLKDLEFQMQTLGLQLLIPQPSGQSATGELIDQDYANTPLAFMAITLQDALELMLGFFALFQGLPIEAGGTVTVNTDFGVSLNASTDAQSLLGAVNAKALTRVTYLRELKRRGLLADDVDPEKEAVDALSDGYDLEDDAEEDDALPLPKPPTDAPPEDPDLEADA